VRGQDERRLALVDAVSQDGRVDCDYDGCVSSIWGDISEALAVRMGVTHWQLSQSTEYSVQDSRSYKAETTSPVHQESSASKQQRLPATS
jgi:hypothetical protein